MAQSLRIAMIGTKGIPARSGGVERHVEEIAVRLAKTGVNVTVYSRPWYTRRTRDTAYKGVHVRSLWSIRTKHLDAISHTIVSVMDAIRMKSDIIHFHGIGPALLAPVVRFLSNARVVTTFHCQDYYHQKWGVVARTALRLGEWCAVRWSHELIVVSQELERHVWATYHRTSRYIPNGANVARVSDRKSASILRSLKIETGSYLLYVGRLIPHKGVHVLIDAVKRLSGTSAPLVIVGAGSYTDGYVQQLRALAKKSGRAIRFLGERRGEQLCALYQGARIVVQPSESEGMSLSLLEAMDYAKPVVVSSIPENQEVMSSRNYTFERGNVNDLARVLEWALRHRRESVAQGAENKKRIQDRYHWNDIATNTVLAYRELYERPRFVRTPISSRLPVRQTVA